MLNMNTDFIRLYFANLGINFDKKMIFKDLKSEFIVLVFSPVMENTGAICITSSFRL